MVGASRDAEWVASLHAKDLVLITRGEKPVRGPRVGGPQFLRPTLQCHFSYDLGLSIFPLAACCGYEG